MDWLEAREVSNLMSWTYLEVVEASTTQCSHPTDRNGRVRRGGRDGSGALRRIAATCSINPPESFVSRNRHRIATAVSCAVASARGARAASGVNGHAPERCTSKCAIDTRLQSRVLLAFCRCSSASRAVTHVPLALAVSP